MRGPTCEAVRESLPRLLAGGPDAPVIEAVRAHLDACEDCREQADLLDTLLRHPIRVPAGLEARIAAAVSRPTRTAKPRFRPLLVAASIALALLVGALVRLAGPSDPGAASSADARNTPGFGLLHASWTGDDALLAGGGLVLDDLTAEELEALLAELDS